MSRSEQRRSALRICLAIPVCVASAFLWCSLLTFDAADPPARVIWPANETPHNWCGAGGANLAYTAFLYLGYGAYPVAFLMALGAASLIRGLPLTDPWLRFIGAGLLCTVFAVGGRMFVAPTETHLMTGPGGVLGTAAADFFVANLGQVGTIILLASAFVVGLLLAADELVMRLGRGTLWFARRSAPVVARGGSALAEAGAAVAGGVATVSGRLATAGAQWVGPVADDAAEPAAARERGAGPAKQLELLRNDDVDPDAGDEPPSPSDAAAAPQNRAPDSAAPPPPPAAAEARKPTPPLPPKAPPPVDDDAPDVRDMLPTASAASKPGIGGAPATLSGLAGGPIVRELGRPVPPRDATRSGPSRAEPGSYTLPHLSVLDEPCAIDKAAIELLCREKAYVLEQTLNEFRLEVRVVAIETGPVITVFELKLAAGIKVSQIVSLANDLARALKAPAVRVVAPLPGKNTIGIEVPNIDKEKVRLKDIIVASAARAQNYAIPLYLGKDASGQALVQDLTGMPHLLIAGTTGSGKSVCVSSIIMSILLAKTPDEVNLILVDPKVVELSIFKDVPHLICPIVTETSKAEAILDWATTKMDERYALLAEVGVKDIRSYNKLGLQGLKERIQPADDAELASIPVHLPYVVIVIDELADLMMTSAKEVEFYLSRLAQKSRAVGIHLIVSTQRPQANVVTGLIKSNLPSRIAFRVASRLDSRIVLDQNGGEVLMGQGDMLFLPPGAHKLVRAQGTFISDEELRGVVNHVRAQRDPTFHPELVRNPNLSTGDGERDELFDQAVEIVLETGRGSVSLLQRRLTIGYGRASRLIEEMARAGIVGDYKGSQAREIQITRDEWNAIRAQRNREEAAERAEEQPAAAEPQSRDFTAEEAAVDTRD